MNNTNPRGQFPWHELLTSDTAGAAAFYQRALGWNAEKWQGSEVYQLFMHKGAPRAGLMSLQDARCAEGTPPSWMCYIGTPNIDAAVVEIAIHGGKVVKGAEDIPGAGRYAIVADPQGAVFGLYESTTASAANADSAMVWHELATTDIEGALKFYQAMFGWKEMQRMDMGPSGTYLIFGADGEQRGGIYAKPSAALVSYWLPYIGVPDAGKAQQAAEAAGGRTILALMQVPGGGWIAQYTDPQGALIAVHAMPAAQPKKASTAKAKPKAKPKAKAKVKAKVKAKAKAKAKSKATAKPKAKPKATKAKSSKRPAKRVAKRRPAKRRPARKK